MKDKTVVWVVIGTLVAIFITAVVLAILNTPNKITLTTGEPMILRCKEGDYFIELLSTSPDEAKIAFGAILANKVESRVFYPPSAFMAGCYTVIVQEDPTSNWMLLIERSR